MILWYHHHPQLPDWRVIILVAVVGFQHLEVAAAVVLDAILFLVVVVVVLARHVTSRPSFV
jgi:hypothetical protein